jgi:23S rRNA (guanosine2251-2'-O)-methyltransferase
VRAGPRRQELEALCRLANEVGVRVEEVEDDRAGASALGAATQGVILDAGPLPELPLEQLAADGEASGTLVALDGVEDPQNLGAIVRVAEAAGVAGLILTRRRAPPLSSAVARASAGAIEWLPVSRVANLPRSLELLKELGFWAFGAEADAPLDLYALPDRLLRGGRVLVLGAEGRGLREGVRRVIDHRVRIPMAGRVASLNVAAAAAVLLFELGRRSRPESSP